MRMLAHAQEVVDAALTSGMYTSDTNGNPTDATVIAALKLATCAQVEWWITTGDEFDQMSQYASFSIEGISATRVGARHDRLCDRAWDALRVAKLLPGTVFST